MPPTVATVPTMSILFAGGLIESDRPRFQVIDPSFPLHDLASRLSEAGRLGRHDPGMQNVNPDARTWRQDESTGPTPDIGHGVKATGRVDGTEP